jgi:CRP/FNR family transcriptional regulator, cyclic AMP receptor protein
MSIAEQCIPRTASTPRAVTSCLRLVPPSSALDVDLFRHDPNARPVVQGETLFEFGETGQEMFVVTHGHIEMRLPHGEAIEVVGPGGLFGEMALVDGSPRAATATAISAAEVVPISRARFSYLVQNTPYFALELMRVMARRLRRMNEIGAGKRR